jgi:hypothetical protein
MNDPQLPQARTLRPDHGFMGSGMDGEEISVEGSVERHIQGKPIASIGAAIISHWSQVSRFQHLRNFDVCKQTAGSVPLEDL